MHEHFSKGGSRIGEVPLSTVVVVVVVVVVACSCVVIVCVWAEEQFSIGFRDNADGVQSFINNISISSTPASSSNSSGETLDLLREFEDRRYI